MMAIQGKVEAIDGGFFEFSEGGAGVDSLCIHGDNPNAVQIARAVRSELEAVGVTIRSFARPEQP